MAAIVQQPSAQETSAARAFWQEKIQAHPNLAGALAIGYEVAGFFLNGHFLVWLGQWIIRVAGYIAETALLFSVLWISATSVAPSLIELFMSAQTMQYLVWLALVTLALIPEIILGNAIINAAGHWHTVTRHHLNIMAWVWAIAFTLPTLLFLILTALTLNALVSDGGTFVQASNGLVGWRCFAGWTYGLLALVYAGIGRRTLSQVQLAVTPGQSAPPVQQMDYAEIARQLLPTLREELKQANGSVLQEVRSEMQGHIERLSAQVVTLQTVQITEQREPVDELESELESDPQIVQIGDYLEGSQEGSHTTLSRGPKVTRQLTPERPSKEPAQNRRGEAQQKALRILKRTPDIGPTELSKRANISLSSAKRIVATANAKEVR